jgi:predicted transcriptional regulator
MSDKVKPKTVNTGVKLDETLHNRLKALGAIKERTPHWLMRAAIEQYVEREEAYEREKQEDLERWQRFQATGHAVPHEQVSAWLESVGTDSELPCPQ